MQVYRSWCVDSDSGDARPQMNQGKTMKAFSLRQGLKKAKGLDGRGNAFLQEMIRLEFGKTNLEIHSCSSWKFYSALKTYLGGHYTKYTVIRQNKYFCGLVRQC